MTPGMTKDIIRNWLKEGKKSGATHTIIVCDGFDHEDYPVHVMPGTDVRTKEAEYAGKSMQRVMEVYCHAMDHEVQLDTARAFFYEPRKAPEPTPEWKFPIPDHLERRLRQLAQDAPDVQDGDEDAEDVYVDWRSSYEEYAQFVLDQQPKAKPKAKPKRRPPPKKSRRKTKKK